MKTLYDLTKEELIEIVQDYQEFASAVEDLANETEPKGGPLKEVLHQHIWGDKWRTPEVES